MFIAVTSFSFASLATAQCSVLSDRAETASGIVFEDLDRDGAYSNNEPAVANVSVSNGCDVVQTDSRGRYSLSVSPAQNLFISQPSGYLVPVDAHNLPQFFYKHYPDGAPAVIAGTPVEWLWPVVVKTNLDSDNAVCSLLKSRTVNKSRNGQILRAAIR